MKVLLTGTHFTVAAATIEELKAYPEVDLVYVGRKTTREGDFTLSQESVELPKLNVKFIPIITGRLQRSFTIYTIPSLLKVALFTVLVLKKSLYAIKVEPGLFQKLFAFQKLLLRSNVSEFSKTPRLVIEKPDW